MIDANQKIQEEKKSGFNPVAAAAVAGAIVGAGVVAAGAVVLSDEKNRDKIKDTASNIKDKAIGYKEDVEAKVQEKKDEVMEKVEEGKEKIKTVTNSVIDSINNEKAQEIPEIK